MHVSRSVRLSLVVASLLAVATACSCGAKVDDAARAGRDRALAPVKLAVEDMTIRPGTSAVVQVEQGLVQQVAVDPPKSGVSVDMDDVCAISLTAARDAKQGPRTLTFKGKDSEAKLVLKVKGVAPPKRR